LGAGLLHDYGISRTTLSSRGGVLMYLVGHHPGESCGDIRVDDYSACSAYWAEYRSPEESARTHSALAMSASAPQQLRVRGQVPEGVVRSTPLVGATRDKPRASA
jgi:hypothetical protein